MIGFTISPLFQPSSLSHSFADDRS